MTQTIRVGVVEDEQAERHRTVAHLRRYETEHDVNIQVRTFSDGRELITGYRPDFDLLLLDVQMGDVDGFETARHVRTLDGDVAIVFVTNMAQHAIKGYEVDALNYLLKPVSYFAISRELARCVARLDRSPTESLVLSSGPDLARVSLADVLYIESTRHRITVHALGRTYALTGTLKSFETELANKGFFRSNNCYLVNLRHVTAVQQSACTMTGGDELQISRPRRRAFLDALTDHLGSRVP